MPDIMINAPVSSDPVPDHCVATEYGWAECPARVAHHLWCTYCQLRWKDVEAYQAFFRLPYIDDDFHRRVLAEAAQRAEDAEVHVTMINDKTAKDRACRLNGLKCPERFPDSGENWCEYCLEHEPHPWEIEHVSALIGDDAGSPFDVLIAKAEEQEADATPVPLSERRYPGCDIPLAHNLLQHPSGARWAAEHDLWDGQLFVAPERPAMWDQNPSTYPS